MPGTGTGDDDDRRISVKHSLVMKLLHALPHGDPLREEIKEALAVSPAIPPGGTSTD